MADLRAKLPATIFLVSCLAFAIFRPDFFPAFSSLLAGNPHYDQSVPPELIAQAWLYHSYSVLLGLALMYYLISSKKSSGILSAAILLYIGVFFGSIALLAAWNPEALNLPSGAMLHHLGVRADSIAFTLGFCLIGLVLVNWRPLYGALHPNK